MEVYIYQGAKRNIGDDLNFWFWKEMMGQAVLKKDNHLLVGIGTILDDRLPKSKTIHVLGSGAGYGKITDCSDWNVHFVRGYLTANALKCDSSAVISDPGILIRLLSPQSVIKKHRISFMPHVGIDSKKYKHFFKSSLLESKLKNLEKNGRFVLSDSEVLLSKQQQNIDKVRDMQREFEFTRQEVYL